MNKSFLFLGALVLAGCAHPQTTPPPAPHAGSGITLTDFNLTGRLSNDLADFTLTATAHVTEAGGGTLLLLSGPVALSAYDSSPGVQLRAGASSGIIPPVAPALEIQHAVYASLDSDGQADVTPRLAEYVLAGRFVLAVTDDAMGVDPAPGHAKELRVDYLFGGYRGQVVVKENETLTLPGGPVTAQPSSGEADSAGKSLSQFTLTFDRAGVYPVRVRFSAAVAQADGWNAVDFRVAPAILQPVVLQGLAPETQFRFDGARPELHGSDFLSYLPDSGDLNLSWKQAAPEEEGKLFYSADMLSQVNVQPGLIRQASVLQIKVMQGEMASLAVALRGQGEVTRVNGRDGGPQVLSWSVEPGTNGGDRTLLVQLNQPQKDPFEIVVLTQTELGAFPQTADVLQLRPLDAARFAGYFRLANEGAVRLEVAQARGVSQVSPEQFPNDQAPPALRNLFRDAGNQLFVYRFAGADYALSLSADQILPEVSVSEVLAYRHEENELDVDAEFELDIRDAPLRELLLHTPKGYTVARLDAPGLSDYFLTEPSGGDEAELRLVFGQPVSGRQLVRVRLEHNQGLAGTQWTLPRVEVARAKSTRGFIGLATEPGYRLTPIQSEGLTDIAPAYFPAQLEGIQAAFRLTDAQAESGWHAAVQIERLPQTIQADALHLFSIGEGIAYGSSLINFNISGAPVTSFKIELSDEYANVEFTGKDLRNWQKTNGGYLVQLHTPVSGPYTLLATYDRPFQAQGQTLVFTGARPLDAQSEQGYTLVVSAYQFQVKPTVVSPGLQALEPGEVPPEYRLFFDAPVLAAYRYSARPINLQLELSPLAQGDSVSQIVDRATYDTHISKQGQVVTTVRYFIKSRGNPDFRLTIPSGSQLWSATINGQPVVPVADGPASLVPLPQGADPNAVLELDLTIASQSSDPTRLTVAAPVASAPVLLGQWTLSPDAGRRLDFRGGSLQPVGGGDDVSGFGQWARVFAGDDARRAEVLCVAMLALVAIALAVWRWALGANAYRFSPAHVCGLVLGLGAIACVFVAGFQLIQLLADEQTSLPGDLTFLAPVQKAGSAWEISVANLPDQTTWADALSWGWPAALAMVLWVCGWNLPPGPLKFIASITGWTAAAWATLRFPNGATAFVGLILAFVVLRLLLPGLARLFRVPAAPKENPPAEAGAAPAAVALLVAGFFLLDAGHLRAAPMIPATPMPDSVNQTIRVENNLAMATAKIHWDAKKGEVLPLLTHDSVLTHADFSAKYLSLEPAPATSAYSHQFVALENGVCDLEVRYELHTVTNQNETSLALPIPFGLINQVQLTVVGLDVDVVSPQAVSVDTDHSTSNTVASLVLTPNPVSLAWHARTRDLRHEKPVFHAELSQLFVPGAGEVDIAAQAAIRLAHGELDDISFRIPDGATVTDVLDARENNTSTEPAPAWRFDSDTRLLRVTLSPARAQNFTLLVRAQIPTGSLPFDQNLGLLTVENAATQIGAAGVATSDEVQLDSVTPQSLSPINLEDFAMDAAAAFRGQLPGLTLRRAYRYSDTAATISLRASAVEPDVRVETEDTLSLGEDHTTLADRFTADITRAGIFNLSFVIPEGFDVDSISGAALNQWTEARTNNDRVITLHLNGKTTGRQTFDISLSGPGLKTAQGWKVPQIAVREAGKQHGTLLIVPEQGMGLQAVAREGYRQLDPQQSGIHQKGVLAFSLLQVPSNLAIDIDRVDPWIEVTSLQHAALRESQVNNTVNLLYQIQNAGLKSLQVLLPASAESVRFQGQQINMFDKSTNAATHGLQEWDVTLDRRVIGQYLLQATYQTPLPTQAAQAVLTGAQALDVNLQRGFVTIQSDPRLQVSVDQLPASLQPAEWQSIPHDLENDLASANASLTYRLLGAGFELPLKLQRHEAARLLPAHVNKITFDSVLSDDGGMLTQARLEILPGDKRLLSVALPAGAVFWFAFVNDNGVWPWRDGGNILIPLEQSSHGDQPVTVEIDYGSRAGAAAGAELDLDLLAPKFDLPLENITWRVSLGDKWKVKHWEGSLQLQSDELAGPTPAVDTGAYLQAENDLLQARTQQARQYYSFANDSLAKGDPQEARRAFEAAYGLSAHDSAFNEDARVQLHNVKLQQALVGLNARQSVLGSGGALAGKWRDLRNRPVLNYTQQDAKDIIDNNNAEDNEAFVRLAEKLIQQQDAALPRPAGIRASIPQQGRLLTFQRAVAVDPFTDLHLRLDTSLIPALSMASRWCLLTGALLAFTVLTVAVRVLRPTVRA